MRRLHLGFNLIELIITVAIAALTLTLALPGVASVLERTRIATTHNQLAGAFSHARLLAMTYRQQAVVCPSADGRGCRNDGIWDRGWITFVDHDSDGTRDSNDELLKADQPANDALQIRSSSGRSRVLFRSNGMARGANLTLRLCNTEGEVRAAMIVNNGGRVRSASRPETLALADC
jgi:type IV fimbrial biogenesis protein FimT